MKPNFLIDDSAYKHFLNIVSENNALGIYLGLKKDGCSGLSYIIDLVYSEDQRPSSVIMNYQKLQLFVEPQHLEAFAGMNIVYKTEGLNSNLIFENPNAQNHCGCGISFQIKE